VGASRLRIKYLIFTNSHTTSACSPTVILWSICNAQVTSELYSFFFFYGASARFRAMVSPLPGFRNDWVFFRCRCQSQSKPPTWRARAPISLSSPSSKPVLHGLPCHHLGCGRHSCLWWLLNCWPWHNHNMYANRKNFVFTRKEGPFKSKMCY